MLADVTGQNIFVHDEDPKFVWIVNLKAGYTSILAALTERFPNLRAHYWEREFDVGRVSREYLVFAFVRHPVGRAVSFYTDKLALSPRQALLHETLPVPQECQSTVFNAYLKFWDPTPHAEPVSDREVFELLERMSFPEFVYLLPVIAKSDRHLYPQSTWLSKFPTLRPHCLVGRLENFSDDWRTVCEKLGTEIALPHRNKSHYGAPGTRLHVNPRWRQVIEDVYEGDMREFYGDDVAA